MRTLRIAAAVAVSATLIGGLTACNSKSAGADAASAAPSAPSQPKVADLDPKAALLASAAVMEKLGSAKLAISASGPKQDAAGAGAVVWKQPQAFEATVKVAGVDATLIAVDGSYYVTLPPAMAKAGKKWGLADSKAVDALAKSGTAGNSPIGGAALEQQLANPALALAANAQGGQLTKVGPEQVNGAQALHIKSTITSDALLGGMSVLTPAQQSLLKSELKLDGNDLVLDFWLDDKAQLVQEKFNNAAGNGEDAATFGYSDFGNAPAITAPPAGEAVGLAELLKMAP